MKAEGFHLAWITVKDLDKAIAFYTEIVGLELKEYHKEFRWAELSGPHGAKLGIGEEGPHSEVPAGANAVITITVEDMDAAIKHFKSKGAKLVGELMEIPGEVKLQTFVDRDGNTLQLVAKP